MPIRGAGAGPSVWRHSRSIAARCHQAAATISDQNADSDRPADCPRLEGLRTGTTIVGSLTAARASRLVATLEDPPRAPPRMRSDDPRSAAVVFAKMASSSAGSELSTGVGECSFGVVGAAPRTLVGSLPASISYTTIPSEKMSVR